MNSRENIHLPVTFAAGIFSSVASAYIFFFQLQIFRNLLYRHETACDIILAHAFNSAFLRRSWSDISSLLFVEVSKREPAFSGGFASKTSVSAPL